MAKLLTSAVLALAALFSFAACESVEPVGALKVAGDTLEGEPIISDEDFEDRKPNTSHIPDEERQGGILQFRTRQ